MKILPNAKEEWARTIEKLMGREKSGELRRLTKTKAAELNPKFSPNGKLSAFTQRGQLYIQNLTGGSLERRSDIKTQHFVVERTGDKPPRLLDTGKAFGFRSPIGSENSKMLALVTHTQDYKTQEIRIADLNTGKLKVVFPTTCWRPSN